MANATANAEALKDKLPFDFVCINDYCPGYVDSRAMGICWKTKKNTYGFFCQICGQDETLTKDEFKDVKQKFTKEQAYRNMDIERKKREEKKKAKVAA